MVPLVVAIASEEVLPPLKLIPVKDAYLLPPTPSSPRFLEPLAATLIMCILEARLHVPRTLELYVTAEVGTFLLRHVLRPPIEERFLHATVTLVTELLLPIATGLRRAPWQLRVVLRPLLPTNLPVIARVRQATHYRLLSRITVRRPPLLILKHASGPPRTLFRQANGFTGPLEATHVTPLQLIAPLLTMPLRSKPA